MSVFSTFLAHQLEAFLHDMQVLVNTECPSDSKIGVDRAGAYIRARAPELGAEVEVLPLVQAGDCVYMRWRGHGRGKVFLIGHLDTVYPMGTAAAHPFRRSGPRLYGPGSVDMKSGLLAGMYAAHALAHLNLDGFEQVALFCNSDEEIGSPYSRDLYSPLARDADAALVLEAARENGAIVSARKGVSGFTLEVKGKAAHAGVEPEKGANANVALAHLILDIQELNGMREGLTVNPGIIRGGTKTNVVPAEARADIDVRFQRAVDLVAFRASLDEISTREYVPGTSAKVVENKSTPPMERTEGTMRLVDWAKDAGREVGLEIRDVATGGGSDGNTLSALGLPVLDGLGPQGGRAHNAAEEFVLLDSIVPRTAMLAHLIETIAARRDEL